MTARAAHTGIGCHPSPFDSLKERRPRMEALSGEMSSQADVKRENGRGSGNESSRSIFATFYFVKFDIRNYIIEHK